MTGEPSGPGAGLTVQSVDCAAPAAGYYVLVADPMTWPVLFPGALDVRPLDGAGRFEVDTLVGDRVQTAVICVDPDPDRLTVGVRSDGPSAPVANSGWEFQPGTDGGSRIVLHRRYEPEGAEGYGISELAALRELGAGGHPVDELVFSFADRVELEVGVAEAYSFVDRSDRWPNVLPHVSRVVLDESRPGVQVMEMDTVTVDGHTHTTRSVRLCRPSRRIAYTQLVPPALLLGHSGVWEFAAAGAVTVVTARHSMAINPVAVAEVLGSERTVADARQYLRDLLGANSRATLAHAGRGAPTADAVR